MKLSVVPHRRTRLYRFGWRSVEQGGEVLGSRKWKREE